MNTTLEEIKQRLYKKIEQSKNNTIQEISSLDELDDNVKYLQETQTNNIITQENVSNADEKATNISSKRTNIFIDKIMLNINVELSQEEINIWVEPCHRWFNIPVDKSIYILFNLLVSDENDFHIKFSKDTKICWMYSQILPNENNNSNPKWTIEILIHQDESIKQDIIPNKVKTFELLLWEESVNYYLNNFYNFIKWKKELLKKEADYHKDEILQKVLEAKKTLEISNNFNTSQIINILEKFNEKNEEKKVNYDEEKETKQRWKTRFERWTFNLKIKDDCKVAEAITYNKNWVEIELLADTLKMWMEPLRRLIKRVEKKKNKTYILKNKKWLKLVGNTWVAVFSKKTIEHYSKSKWFITIEWFFEVLAYAKSV